VTNENAKFDVQSAVYCITDQEGNDEFIIATSMEDALALWQEISNAPSCVAAGEPESIVCVAFSPGVTQNAAREMANLKDI
jgi:hypothetical protein